MAQPFRNALPADYRPPDWPGLVIRFAADRIAVSGAGSLRVLSSAFYNGGFGEAEAFVNRKVPLDYEADRPEEEMRRYLSAAGYRPFSTVGMLTAAKLTHASILSETGGGCRLVVVTTAGTRNAARAGTDRQVFPAYRPGTINTLLLANAAVTDAAMVNAVMTATEAKAAALADADIRDEFTPTVSATGTTTDAIVIAVTGRAVGGALHEYAGTASELGHAIGRLVYASVLEAVRTQHEP